MSRPISLFHKKQQTEKFVIFGSKTSIVPFLNMSWTSWSTRSAASLVKWHLFGSFDFIGSKIKGISKPVTTFRIIGSFFSFCQFLMKYFVLSALGSCLIFLEINSLLMDVFCKILMETEGPSSWWEVLLIIFFLIPFLSSCRALLLKGLTSSYEHSPLPIPSGSK